MILIVLVIIVFAIYAIFTLSGADRNDGVGSGGISSPEIAAVYVLDVGEALSVFIDNADTEILIDGGNESDGERIADFVSEYISDDTIEYVIATHSHADHIGGLDHIYERYDVVNTIYGDTGTSKQFEQFMSAAQSEIAGKDGYTLKEDIDETIDLPQGCTLTIFDIIDGSANTNNNSVISIFECAEKKVLITGDAEDEKSKTVRDALVNDMVQNRASPVDVFVVGHHGSETSNSDELLGAIRPKYAIISSEGPNGQYNNPAPDVIERLYASGAKIFATYRSGNIRIGFTNDEMVFSPPESEVLTPGNYKDAA